MLARLRINEFELGAIGAAFANKFRDEVVDAIEFDQVPRLGLSGVPVYRARAMLKDGMRSHYFYAKVGWQPIFKGQVDNLKRLQAELNNYHLVEGIRKIAPECWHGVYSFRPRDLFDSDVLKGQPAPKECEVLCIAYEEVGNVDPRSRKKSCRHGDDYNPPPKTLSDHLEDYYETWQGDVNRTVAALESMIGYLYAEINEGWKNSGQVASIKWAELYCEKPYDYLRRDRLANILKAFQQGMNRKDKHPLLRELTEVCEYTDGVLRNASPIKVRCRTVHGDLQQRNIIVHELHPEARPWVIDFGWTKHNHAMIDYALLESSLTNFYFARKISDGRLEDLRQGIFDKNIRLSACTSLERLYVKTVQTIREAAEKEATNWPDEYLISSFLITVGLIGSPTARIPTLVRHACSLWRQADL